MRFKVGDFVKITDKVTEIRYWKDSIGQVGRVVVVGGGSYGVIFFEEFQAGTVKGGHVLPLNDVRYFGKNELEKIPKRVGVLYAL